jgi:hypothetical protein
VSFDVHRIESVVERVRAALSDDLLKPEYRRREGRGATSGHCYVASEAIYHLIGKDQGLVPFQLEHEGDSHWFLADVQRRHVVDATADQFATLVPYAQGRRRSFLHPSPSRRARELIARVEI